MKELLKNQYNKILKLLDDGIKQPEIISIIEKNNPGTIFVDNVDMPNTALIWNPGMGGFYLIGDCENNFFLQNINKFIDDDIAEFLRDRQIDDFEVSGGNGLWEKTIENIFHSRDLKRGRQLIYTWDKTQKIKEPIENFNYSIYSLRSREVNMSQYINWKYYEGVLRSFWGDIDQFLDKGDCYYALDGNKIIGVCYTSFVTSNTKAIGVETDKEYRNQGVGYALAHRCIDEILKEGNLPWWDCMETNLSSRRLAEKVGLVKTHDYFCYYFNLNYKGRE